MDIDPHLAEFFVWRETEQGFDKRASTIITTNLLFGAGQSVFVDSEMTTDEM